MVFFKEGQAIARGGNVSMQDATDTAQTSPLALTTSIATLEIPTNAVAVVLRTPTAAIRVGVDADLSDGYALLPAAEKHRIPCADGNALYVRTDSGSDNLTFYFEIA